MPPRSRGCSVFARSAPSPMHASAGPGRRRARYGRPAPLEQVPGRALGCVRRHWYAHATRGGQRPHGQEKHWGGTAMTRRALFAALTSLATFAGAAAQTADDFPSRPIRIIVPQAAGSGVDLQARVLAQQMGELWGQQGVVTNRAGANGIIGMEAGANAKPDGYTLIYAPVSAVTTNAFIYKKLPYDTFRDFAPITQTTANPLGAVVNPSSGIKSIKDLIERAKANPGGINYGSFGIGNMTHLMGVLLSIAADIKMTHVPYRGQTPAITDVVSGQIPIAFTTTAGV